MPSPQYQRNQASLRALKHQCLFDFDFRRELLPRTRLSHKALEMKSSSLLTDGALAKWEASLKLEVGRGWSGGLWKFNEIKSKTVGASAQRAQDLVLVL
jgi:hypothetical protein